MGTFWDYMRSLGQTQRAITYYTGGEQNFEQRVGSSRIARGNTTFVNPTTIPAFKEANRKYEKAEPYLDYVPIVGSGARTAKSIWMGGNGSNNKAEVAANATGFIVDFATTFAGGAGPVRKVGVGAFKVAEEGAENLTKKTLFHFTSEEGFNGIIKTGELFASKGAKNARYGAGQYFTDIAPGQMTRGQTAFRLYGDPRKRTTLTHYFEIDVTDLTIVNPRPNVFLFQNETTLNITNRIVNKGPSFFTSP
jgi:hypothetical protein